ncbi:hypothetical protein LCGC14_1863540, partial [marine sediment metagenome]
MHRFVRIILAAAMLPAICSAARADPAPGQYFASRVVEFSPGAGYEFYPDSDLSLGGPRGGGALVGSMDVVSLGVQGVLVLGFAPSRAVTDGAGADLIVFENAFDVGQWRFAELVRVGVSTDGLNYAYFPTWCGLTSAVLPYQPIDPTQVSGFAGVGPVLANVDSNGIDPFDPATAGGDAFDLAALASDPLVLGGQVDLGRIYYVKLVDVLGDGLAELDSYDNPIYDPTGDMTEPPYVATSADIDAVSVVHGLLPAVAGDVTRNGVVNITDLGALAANWQKSPGATWEDGDFTGDGTVNITDLGALASNWNLNAAQTVPEPASLAIWLAGSAAVI